MLSAWALNKIRRNIFNYIMFEACPWTSGVLVNACTIMFERAKH